MKILNKYIRDKYREVIINGGTIPVYGKYLVHFLTQLVYCNFKFNGIRYSIDIQHLFKSYLIGSKVLYNDSVKDVYPFK